MTVTVEESGMTFGPFSEDCFYHIEKSENYRKIACRVKMAEFLLLRHREGKPPVVYVVEAKSSSPRPGAGNKDRVAVFIDEIREKLVNAFSLGFASSLGRHPGEGEPPQGFRALNPADVEFRFVVVIRGHRKEWLSPLRDALAKALRPFVKTWALSKNGDAVVVLDDEGAGRYGFIRSRRTGPRQSASASRQPRR